MLLENRAQTGVVELRRLKNLTSSSNLNSFNSVLRSFRDNFKYLFNCKVPSNFLPIRTNIFFLYIFSPVATIKLYISNHLPRSIRRIESLRFKNGTVKSEFKILLFKKNRKKEKSETRMKQENCCPCYKIINLVHFRAQVIFLLVAITAAYSLVTINAKPLDNDGAEIVMKIEKINEQLPGNERRRKFSNFAIN